MKEKIMNQMLYFGLNKKQYQQAIKSIYEKNYNMLIKVTFLSTLLLAVLYGCSFFVRTIIPNRRLYFIFFILMIILYLYTKLVIQNNKKYSVVGCYLLLIFAYIFSIIMGVSLQSHYPATTFCVLLLALPLLIIDKPYRVSILLIGVTIVFCFWTNIEKTDTLAMMDMVNGFCFLFLSIIVNFWVMKMKVKEIIYKGYVEKERDTDDLTKLLTKAAGTREINEYISKNKDYAILVIFDLDNFKEVNDTMGHVYGDALLRVIGSCITTTIKKENILCRFGGDEFIMFFPHLNDDQEVIACIQTLMKKMKEELSEMNLNITGSFGIAFYPMDGQEYEEILKNADQALYYSKTKGKNQFAFYNEINKE